MPALAHLVHDGVALAFRFVPGAGPLCVFLPGYLSDMDGTKALALEAWAKAAGRACLRLDYAGCGQSGGEFLDGSIGRWTSDVLALIGHVWPPPGRVLLVGSSMGGWIALLAGLALGDRLAGLVGIAAAPDFTVWGLHIGAAERRQLAAQGHFTRPSADGAPCRYSRALIEDAPAQLLLDGTIPITAPVRLLHGQRDDAVPWRLSIDIAARLAATDVTICLIKDGDHRLSRERDIAVMLRTMEDVCIAPR